MTLAQSTYRNLIMTTQQRSFVHLAQTKGIGKRKNISNHRVCFFMPSWLRDGYKGLVHYYHDRASPAAKFQAMNDPTHPDHELAKRAAEMKL